jgi:hypothetical protein
MVGIHPSEVDTTQYRQFVEEVLLELGSLSGRDGLRATKTRYQTRVGLMTASNSNCASACVNQMPVWLGQKVGRSTATLCMVELPYILKSNPHPNLIRTQFLVIS